MRKFSYSFSLFSETFMTIFRNTKRSTAHTTLSATAWCKTKQFGHSQTRKPKSVLFWKDRKGFKTEESPSVWARWKPTSAKVCTRTSWCRVINSKRRSMSGEQDFRSWPLTPPRRTYHTYTDTHTQPILSNLDEICPPPLVLFPTAKLHMKSAMWLLIDNRSWFIAQNTAWQFFLTTQNFSRTHMRYDVRENIHVRKLSSWCVRVEAFGSGRRNFRQKRQLLTTICKKNKDFAFSRMEELSYHLSFSLDNTNNTNNAGQQPTKQKRLYQSEQHHNSTKHKVAEISHDLIDIPWLLQHGENCTSMPVHQSWCHGCAWQPSLWHPLWLRKL